MTNYEEILTMMVVQPFVSVNATPTYTMIRSIYNTLTHVEMVTADIEKWAKDHDIKVEVETGETPLFDELFTENDSMCDTIKLYNEDGFVQIWIELYYH
jgi:hypothetical protein